jgi:hypothetical protein
MAEKLLNYLKEALMLKMYFDPTKYYQRSSNHRCDSELFLRKNRLRWETCKLLVA